MKFAPVSHLGGLILFGLAALTFGQQPTPPPREITQPPRLLKLTPVPTSRVERLTPAAREQYLRGMQAADRINYKAAMDYFQKAVEAEPGNVYLRFTAAQMAQYMGQSSWGADSIRYFDIAAQNLKELADSPKLNAREKERAQNALNEVIGLRQTVGERDEKRRQYGMEIAKDYAKQIAEVRKAKEESIADIEKRDKAKRLKEMYDKALGASTARRSAYNSSRGYSNGNTSSGY